MIILAVACIGAFICSLLASGKQRSALGWFFIGFFLPLIGIILIVVLPNGGGGLQVPPDVDPYPVQVQRPAPTALDELDKLAGLRDRGVLSPQEFEAKKRDLLARA
jgi:hypothetical protein